MDRSAPKSTPAASTHINGLMDALRRFLLVLVVVSTAECSGTAKPTCEDYDMEDFYLVEGEAFYFVPYVFSHIKPPPDEEFTWYKNNTKVEFSDVKDRILYRGEELFLLDLRPEDSGLYTARHVAPSGTCSNYYVNINVLKRSDKNSSALLYGSITNSHDNKMIPCPNPVRKTCDVFKGNFTWFKDSSLVKGEHENSMWVENATERDDGTYMCVCAWTYNNKTHNSSGSRRLITTKKIKDIQILSPVNNEQLAEEGSAVTLNCTVLCEAEAALCRAGWAVNGEPVEPTDDQNATTKTVTLHHSQNVFTATLIIGKVSAEDFHSEFTCKGKSSFSAKSITVRLKPKKPRAPVLIRALCVLAACLSVAVLLRCFAIDLALCFRPCFTAGRHEKDMRLYDAYVVYQSQSLDKASEDTLYRFVSNTLPSVLEEKCGYQLFIHGRDDIPGEESLELAEDRMRQSRRLMVILTQGSDSPSDVTENTPVLDQNSQIGGFDWQVGLQQALVQMDKNVILIQLGDPGPKGYARLYPHLRKLIHQSAPLRWQEGSRGAAKWNSHFWKRVRYLMPATPVKKRLHSDVV